MNLLTLTGRVFIKTQRSRNGELLNRGINSIQLFRRDGHWKISAMIWRREGRDVKIPLEKADSKPRGQS